MALYQLTSGTAVLRTSDGAMVPAAPGNDDWEAYLAWVGSGQAPDPVPAPLLADDPTFAADPWMAIGI